jgi:hypothetical protein
MSLLFDLFAGGSLRRLRRLVLLATGLGAGACSLYGIEPPTSLHPGGSAPPPEELGQAVLHISAVPEDVQCLRITAAGPGRTVAKELAVNGTAALSQNLTGLPLGTVIFTGEAFPAACTSVSKSSIAA